jgi:hypothetical protein
MPPLESGQRPSGALILNILYGLGSWGFLDLSVDDPVSAGPAKTACATASAIFHYLGVKKTKNNWPLTARVEICLLGPIDIRWDVFLKEDENVFHPLEKHHEISVVFPVPLVCVHVRVRFTSRRSGTVAAP